MRDLAYSCVSVTVSGQHLTASGYRTFLDLRRMLDERMCGPTAYACHIVVRTGSLTETVHLWGYPVRASIGDSMLIEHWKQVEAGL
jgi:hypothetical protein